MNAPGNTLNQLVEFMPETLRAEKIKNKSFIISQSGLVSKMLHWRNLFLQMGNFKIMRGI